MFDLQETFWPPPFGLHCYVLLPSLLSLWVATLVLTRHSSGRPWAWSGRLHRLYCVPNQQVHRWELFRTQAGNLASHLGKRGYSGSAGQRGQTRSQDSAYGSVSAVKKRKGCWKLLDLECWSQRGFCAVSHLGPRRWLISLQA